MKYIVRWWLYLRGWRFVGNFPRGIKKCVIVIAPHTHMYDFLLIYANMKIRNYSHDLMVPKDQYISPWKWVINACHPILNYDSNSPRSLAELKNKFEHDPNYRLAFFPEKSLERSDTWDEVFYDLAKEMDVPIILLALDYKRKWIKYHIPFKASMDRDRDLLFIKRFFSTCEPKFPEKGVFV